MPTYNNYPKSATNQAKRALKFREENGTSCGTRVGWTRARQLANRVAIDLSTVKRTFSFLSRAKTYDQGKFTDADGKEICGSIMYAAWGGDTMKNWAEKTIKMEEERKISSVYKRAFFEPATFNEESRTVDVVFATESPVLRSSNRGDFYEVLNINEQSIRMDRLNAGAPVLNDHKADDLSDVIGVVERAWIQNSTAYASIKFSDREFVKPIIQDVKDGILRNVSVGYRIWRMEKEDDNKEVPTYRAMDWQPFEISLVSIPADSRAQIRHFETEEEKQDFDFLNKLKEEERTRSLNLLSKKMVL